MGQFVSLRNSLETHEVKKNALKIKNTLFIWGLLVVLKDSSVRGYGGMVDTTDLKSVEALSSCGFKSRFPHQSKPWEIGAFFLPETFATEKAFLWKITVATSLQPVSSTVFVLNQSESIIVESPCLCNRFLKLKRRKLPPPFITNPIYLYHLTKKHYSAFTCWRISLNNWVARTVIMALYLFLSSNKEV